MAVRDNLTGRRFGQLVVVGLSHTNRVGAYWNCICDCGASPVVRANSLRKAKTISCGCVGKRRGAANLLRAVTKHGMRLTAEYRAWCKAKERCYDMRNKRWADYGGRGIKMHASWLHDFKSFFDHIGPKPSTEMSIDRINVNGHYEPGNVRWADKTTQRINQRPRKR